MKIDKATSAVRFVTALLVGVRMGVLLRDTLHRIAREEAGDDTSGEDGLCPACGTALDTEPTPYEPDPEEIRQAFENLPERFAQAAQRLSRDLQPFVDRIHLVQQRTRAGQTKAAD
jgi:hypothetical protein